MFVRCKKRFKDGKEHRYWSVVESTRVGGGRVVQRQLLYLGEINDSQRAEWCRSIEVLSGGAALQQMALFPEDRPAPVLDCDVVQIQLDKLELRDPRQWGACWLALALWDRLGLDRFWGPRLPPSRKGTRWLDILKVQVCYHLIDPGSDWRLHRHWYEHSALRDLLGSDRVISDDKLYRCLDRLLSLATQYPRLRLSWMTVHGSKGLEADYVVVLGLCSGKWAFPTEVAADPILSLALAAPEDHPNAEERRLFYVAMTRARRHAFLLADGGPASSFVQELIDGSYDITVFGRLPESKVPCPKCVEGHLVRRENARDRGTFYGCSNWPYCEHAQAPCPNCGKGLPVKKDGEFHCRNCGKSVEACPNGDGWLRTRTGTYGRFLGCSNWPACDYTRDFRQERKRRGTPAGFAGWSGQRFGRK